MREDYIGTESAQVRNEELWATNGRVVDEAIVLSEKAEEMRPGKTERPGF